MTVKSRRSREAPPPAADGDTEQRILEAAHRVFVRRGTAGARMQEIAAEAGVNHALLHYYFRSKAALARAVFQTVARRLLPPVMAALGSDAPIEEKVEQVIHLEIDHLSQHPFLPAYLIGELHHDPQRARELATAALQADPAQVRPRVMATLRRQIAEAVRAGTMRPITPEQFTVNLLSLCIFPFAARPMLTTMLGLDQKAYERFIAQRRAELPAFFLRALRP
ncbi:MAG: TetR/AcrR family transcriptional regulator [Gemmatimonadaceae bacterium]|nr:TetR/AcrR family transcriptional regulator [Gemmatimonadaceae bacterium]